MGAHGRLVLGLELEDPENAVVTAEDVDPFSSHGLNLSRLSLWDVRRLRHVPAQDLYPFAAQERVCRGPGMESPNMAVDSRRRSAPV